MERNGLSGIVTGGCGIVTGALAFCFRAIPEDIHLAECHVLETLALLFGFLLDIAEA